VLKTSEEATTEGELIATRPSPAPAAIVLALATVYIVWGSTYLAMRIAVATLPPFLMAGTRFVVAGLIACGWVWARGATMPNRREVIDAFVVGALMLVGGNGSVVWALQTVPSGLAALIVTTVPLWVALLDWLRPGGARPNAATVVSLLLGVAGVAWLIVPKMHTDDGVPIEGCLFLVFSALSWTLGSLYARARSQSRREPFLKTVALQMLAGGMLLLLCGVVRGEIGSLDPAKFSGKSVAAMAYLIVAGSLMSYTAYGWLLTVVRPTLVATYAFVNPVAAVLLGYALADEVLSRDVLLAGGAVVASVALMVLAQPRTSKTVERS